MTNNSDTIIQLNIGGTEYSAAFSTLAAKYPKSRLGLSVAAVHKKAVSAQTDLIPIIIDSEGRFFIDRDGDCFRYVLDYLRKPKNSDGDWITKLIPSVADRFRLRLEAEFYGLTELVKELSTVQSEDKSFKLVKARPSHANVPEFCTSSPSKRPNPISFERSISSEDRLATGGPYFITIGYRGSFTAAKDAPSNEPSKFRKITRITVSGRSDIAKEVFLDDLNDSRDPERYPYDAYTSRYYLKHNYLENAFETLAKKGFQLVSSCSSGSKTLPSINKEEYKQWITYMEYVFFRDVMKST